MANDKPSPALLADLSKDLRKYAERADLWLEAVSEEHPKRPTKRQLRERDIQLAHFLYQLAEDLVFWRRMVEEMPEDYS